MTVSDVLALLDAERDERGVSNREKLGLNTAGMRSVGLGLTRLRKLAKRIGRNRELAQARSSSLPRAASARRSNVAKHLTTDRLTAKLGG